MTRERRPLTLDESQALAHLQFCSFPCASWDKRFVRKLSCETITGKESAQLFRLLIKYRRQFNSPDKARLLAVAEKLAAPDFRKLEAARRDQARIDEEKAKYETSLKGHTNGS